MIFISTRLLNELKWTRFASGLFLLDLDWRWGKCAREAGVLTCISPDAHSTSHYDHLAIGVGIARKAGFSAEEVVNTYSAEKFVEPGRGDSS